MEVVESGLSTSSSSVHRFLFFLFWFQNRVKSKLHTSTNWVNNTGQAMCKHSVIFCFQRKIQFLPWQIAPPATWLLTHFGLELLHLELVSDWFCYRNYSSFTVWCCWASPALNFPEWFPNPQGPPRGVTDASDSKLFSGSHMHRTTRRACANFIPKTVINC